MHLLVASLSVLFAQGSLAVPHQKPRSPNKSCQRFEVPVSASAVNARYDIPTVNDDLSVTEWVLESDRWSSPHPFRILENITVSDTFTIHAQLCTPGSSASNKNGILQIATHGLIYDKRYWEPEFIGNSYVDAAGYSIFTYDRLSTGLSSKPDGHVVVQSPLELEILRQLTIMARDGRLYTLAKREHSADPVIQQLAKPSKIVHVGHSFGSILTSSLLSTYGNLSDGAIITGFIPNKYGSSSRLGAFGFEFARSNAPRFSDRPNGYIVPGTRSLIHQLFFAGLPSDSIGGFTEEMLGYGDATKQPGTVGEFNSFNALNLGPAPAFQGPIQFMEARFDYAACGGDCQDAYDLATLNQLYPKAAALEVFLQPNTGHGLTLHRNATAGYQATFDFLAANGL